MPSVVSDQSAHPSTSPCCFVYGHISSSSLVHLPILPLPDVGVGQTLWFSKLENERPATVSSKTTAPLYRHENLLKSQKMLLDLPSKIPYENPKSSPKSSQNKPSSPPKNPQQMPSNDGTLTRVPRTGREFSDGPERLHGNANDLHHASASRKALLYIYIYICKHRYRIINQSINIFLKKNSIYIYITYIYIY